MASSSKLFELEQIEIENTNVDATRIFEEMHKEIGYYLILEGNDADFTDGVLMTS